MKKLQPLLVFILIFIFFFLQFHYVIFSEEKNQNNFIKLSIKYKSNSTAPVKISYHTIWNLILPDDTILLDPKKTKDWKIISTEIPANQILSSLQIDFGWADSTSLPLIDWIKINYSGTKFQFQKKSIQQHFIALNNFSIQNEGKIIIKENSRILNNLILKTKNIESFILENEYKRLKYSGNPIKVLFLSFISAIISFSLYLFIFKKQLKLINRIYKFIYNIKNIIIINLLIMLLGILYFSVSTPKNFVINTLYNKPDLTEVVLEEKYAIFDTLPRNPKSNLIYNGNFKYGLMFWGCNADSSFHKIIDTPYGKGVRITRTDGNGGYWSLMYLGKPITYYSGHTYKVSFKCKIINGQGIPFHIGWWTKDGETGYSAAFLKKNITSLGNSWVQIEVKYTFKNDQKDLVFFLNSLKDNTIIEITDIKLFDITNNNKLEF